MFKLVVLCAFFVAASAEPGALIAAPITQYSTFVTPGTASISSQYSNVIHPSPVYYQAPLAYTHFIKKRSAQIPLAYAAPATYYPNYYAAPATYYPNYYAATTYNAPLIHSASILPAPNAPIAPVSPVHLIKKRSAPLFPATTYYASSIPTTYAATTPLLTSTYSAPILTHSPLISQPLTYSHLIKKRSAGLLLAPTSYQTRFDLNNKLVASPVTYSSPFVYSSPIQAPFLSQPLVYSQFIKK